METQPPRAGYSQRPLAEKLGIKAGQTIAVLNPPLNYLELLEGLPPGVVIEHKLSIGLPFIHFFCTQRSQLEASFPGLREALTQTGMVWISWPKRTVPKHLIKVPTDLDENFIRDLGLACGLVDVKVAAIDATWSGLKFVFRLKDRK